MHVDGVSRENSFDMLRSLEEDAFPGGELNGDANQEEGVEPLTEAFLASDVCPRAGAHAGNVLGVPGLCADVAAWVLLAVPSGE